MKIFPAIDIKDKKCVRLVKGDFNNKTEYEISPVDQAGKYKDHGFKNLHIVDLDGALIGETVNLDIIQEIVTKFDLKIEIGGGIRNFDSIQKYTDAGVEKVILGSAAIKDKNFLFLIAALPKITFSTPVSKYLLILSKLLIPPPISILRSYLLTISWIISRLTVSPVRAPSRSTMCKFLKP